jgi:hypothetical protein
MSDILPTILLSISMIYTSYHARVKTLREAGLVPINISRFAPRFVPGPYPSYKALAPIADMLKMPEQEYRIKFAEILSKLDPKQVADELQALGNGKHVVLCCYEGPGKFCHRHLVADWLGEAIGMPVEEIAFSKPIK